MEKMIEKQLSCQKCGADCKPTFKFIDSKSELGLNIKIQIYKCENCGEEHIICPECEGTGYQTFFDVHDCHECSGMGVISLKSLNERN